MSAGLIPPDVVGQIPTNQHKSPSLSSWHLKNKAGFGTQLTEDDMSAEDDLYDGDYVSAENTNSRENEEEDMRQFLASLSAEEVAFYQNLTGSAAPAVRPAAYHKTKSADFQSFETVANPDAEITVRKVLFSFFHPTILFFRC
jgi:hypothetical protein